MGRPFGGDAAYSAKDGLDLSQGPSVDVYHIHPDASAFRHWDTPVTDTQPVTETAADGSECFSSLQFETEGISGIPFNFEGSDTMIWAMNGVDAYMGYHGGASRGFVDITWATGASKVFVEGSSPPPPQPPVSQETRPTDSPTTLPNGAIVAVALVSSVVLAVIVGWCILSHKFTCPASTAVTLRAEEKDAVRPTTAQACACESSPVAVVQESGPAKVETPSTPSSTRV